MATIKFINLIVAQYSTGDVTTDCAYVGGRRQRSHEAVADQHGDEDLALAPQPRPFVENAGDERLQAAKLTHTEQRTYVHAQ